MRGFRKPEGEIPTQVQILYPPLNMNKDQSILISGACLFKESRGRVYWLVVKNTDEVGWEIPKATVRKGESSVRAILRVLGELAGMSVRVLEEVGRASSSASVNGRSISQKFLYYLLIYKTSAGEILGFTDFEWLEQGKAIKKLSIKREKSMLREAKVVLKTWEKIHGKAR